MADTIAVELRRVVKRFEDVVAVDNLSLTIREGEFFSLLGPSGCGKTTTLRMIAGFEHPTSGEIYIGGEPQSYLPAYRRPVNTVFQSYALFPHMTVYQNVAFGLEMHNEPKVEIRRRVGEALELVHLPGMDNRRPNQLSGGQQQRVALARALVNRPKVLLLDEPLGALDLKLRRAMQVELKTLQHQIGITFIYVTHDQEEALTMSDRIAVMHQGHVLQLGTPQDIYETPKSLFVADFIGETNFIPGTIRHAGATVSISFPDGTVTTAGWAEDGLVAGTEAMLSIRPEKIQVYPVGTPQPAQIYTQFPARVEEVIYAGTDTRYVLGLGELATLVARQQNASSNGRRFNTGDQVTVRWDASHARILRA
jgi:spermidine/putrescine transport system ATP-binding protein